MWVQLLENDEIESETLTVYLNFPHILTKVYRRIAHEANTMMRPSAPDFDFETLYVDEKNLVLLAELLNSVAGELAASYEHGREIVKTEMKAIEEQIEKSKIMNTYLLFGILKQTSHNAQAKAE